MARWAVMLIILIGVVLRLLRLDIPFDPEDVHLDYLAAHHIAQYGEVPLSGSGNPLLIDSPLYYYIVAFFVWIHDNILFLGVVNIVIIQVITFWLMYRLAVELFDKRVGVIAVILAVTSFEYFAQGAYFFQTHVMQVFANGAFLYLVKAYKHKQTRFAYISVVLIAIALTIHHSILAILPLYLVFIYRVGPFFRLMATGLGMLIFLHIPIFILIQYDSAILSRIFGSFSTGYVQSLWEFLNKFVINLMQFLYAFSLRWSNHNMQINSLLALLLLGSFMYVTKKRYLWLIILTILQLIIVASFLRTGVWNFTFSSVFGLYVILIATCIAHWFSGGFWHKSIGILTLCISVYACSNEFVVLRESQYPRLYRWNLTQESTKAVAQAIPNESSFRIQRVHKKPEGGFFVNVYSEADIQVIEDLLYWPELEKELGTRFTRMEKDGTFPTILNSDEYIFVICDSTRAVFTELDDCLSRYFKDYPEYRFVRLVYEQFPVTIALVRRNIL